MFVVQIGAADGKIDVHREIDEVYEGVTKYGWKAILVEPSTNHFQELQQNYKNYKSQVELLNVAIAHWDGMTVFYESSLRGASTLIENVLARNNYHNGKTKEYKERIVNCITIDTLLSRVNEFIDYLIIDAEGYDGYILEALNLEKYPIPKIRFEFAHLEDGEQQQAQLGRVCLKLIKAEYRLLHDKADIIAEK